jgi:hypothetical protein
MKQLEIQKKKHNQRCLEYFHNNKKLEQKYVITGKMKLSNKTQHIIKYL